MLATQLPLRTHRPCSAQAVRQQARPFRAAAPARRLRHLRPISGERGLPRAPGQQGACSQRLSHTPLFRAATSAAEAATSENFIPVIKPEELPKGARRRRRTVWLAAGGPHLRLWCQAGAARTLPSPVSLHPTGSSRQLQPRCAACSLALRWASSSRRRARAPLHAQARGWRCVWRASPCCCSGTATRSTPSRPGAARRHAAGAGREEAGLRSCAAWGGRGRGCGRARRTIHLGAAQPTAPPPPPRRSPAEGAYSEGFKNAKFTQDYSIECPSTGTLFSLRDGSIVSWYPSNPVLRMLTPQDTCRPLEIYPVRLTQVRLRPGAAAGVSRAGVAGGYRLPRWGGQAVPHQRCRRPAAAAARATPQSRGLTAPPRFPCRAQAAIEVDVSGSSMGARVTKGGANTSLENNNVYGLEPKTYVDAEGGSGLANNATVTVVTTVVGLLAVAGTAAAIYWFVFQPLPTIAQ